MRKGIDKWILLVYNVGEKYRKDIFDMKLRNFLGMPETMIENILRVKGFCYAVNDSYNYGWTKLIHVGGEYVWEVTVHCDLNNYELSLNRTIYQKSTKDFSHDQIKINIPKELIEEYSPYKFIDWLDETCEPYFNYSEGN